MKKALITGITGQDGSYLAELLLDKGYEVYGAFRRVSLPDQSHRFGRINHLKDNPHLILLQCDITCPGSVYNAVQKSMPDELYHLAAQSDVALSSDDPFQTIHSNVDGTYNVLESIRRIKPDTKFYFAATSELFGKVHESPQNEKTSFHPRSPYAVSKATGFFATQNYREAFDMFGCSGILFNHESPRRGLEFVTQKIVQGLNKVINNGGSPLELGELDSKRDWGFAGDYVKMMWKMLQQQKPEDYVIGTGISHSVREFAEHTANTYGVDLKWKGNDLNKIGVDNKSGKILIKINPKFKRPAEVHYLLADPSKARKELDWNPTVNFEELVKMMVNGR